MGAQEEFAAATAEGRRIAALLLNKSWRTSADHFPATVIVKTLQFTVYTPNLFRRESFINDYAPPFCPGHRHRLCCSCDCSANSFAFCQDGIWHVSQSDYGRRPS